MAMRDRCDPRLTFAPPDASRLELTLGDLSELPEEAREARGAALALEDALRPFDLRRGPLLRLRLVRLAEREHLLLLTLHHVVSDGWWQHEVHREYHFAELRRGDCLWVYYDRNRRRWFWQSAVE